LLLCSLLAVAIAFPSVFIALDHHAVERLPGHLHLAALGEIAQNHAHAFEEPHTHAAAGVSMLAETADLIVRAAAEIPWLVVYLLMAFALPLLRLALSLGIAAGWPWPATRVAGNQLPARPPTRPPTALLVVA
jgi:hypothetical protein